MGQYCQSIAMSNHIVGGEKEMRERAESFVWGEVVDKTKEQLDFGEMLIDFLKKEFSTIFEEGRRTAFKESIYEINKFLNIAGMTPDKYFLNEMPVKDFVEFILYSENHHEEFAKEIRRIFSDSLGRAAYEVALKIRNSIRSIAGKGE